MCPVMQLWYSDAIKRDSQYTHTQEQTHNPKTVIYFMLSQVQNLCIQFLLPFTRPQTTKTKFVTLEIGIGVFDALYFFHTQCSYYKENGQAYPSYGGVGASCRFADAV